MSREAGDLMDTRTVAKRLGICRDLVSRYVKEGLLPAIELPHHKHPKFRQSDVDSFVESCKKDGPALAPSIPVDVPETPVIVGPARRGRKSDPNVRHVYGPNWAQEFRDKNA